MYVIAWQQRLTFGWVSAAFLPSEKLEGFSEGSLESCEKQIHRLGLAPWFEAELTAPPGNQHNSTPRNARFFHPLISGASQPQGTSLAGEPCDIKVRFKNDIFPWPNAL